jgi:hypothetical protein
LSFQRGNRRTGYTFGSNCVPTARQNSPDDPCVVCIVPMRPLTDCDDPVQYHPPMIIKQKQHMERLNPRQTRTMDTATKLCEFIAKAVCYEHNTIPTMLLARHDDPSTGERRPPLVFTPNPSALWQNGLPPPMESLGISAGLGDLGVTGHHRCLRVDSGRQCSGSDQMGDGCGRRRDGRRRGDRGDVARFADDW